MTTVRQNIETLRDKLDAFKDTVAFVRRGRNPKTLLDRLRHAPYHMRERHVLRTLKRLGVNVDPEFRKHVESVLKGTADGTEGVPVCDVCLTAFQPRFESDDGIVSTDTTCAGCLRTRQKEAAT